MLIWVKHITNWNVGKLTRVFISLSFSLFFFDQPSNINILNVSLLFRSDAAEEYRKALEEDADDCNALVNLANAQRQQGETEEAVEHYKRVLELQPKHATAALNLGNAYQTLGDMDAATKMYEVSNEQANAFCCV